MKDSVDRGAPTREIATASRYLMLAAMSICTDSMNAFEHYLDASEAYQRETQSTWCWMGARLPHRSRASSA